MYYIIFQAVMTDFLFKNSYLKKVREIFNCFFLLPKIKVTQEFAFLIDFIFKKICP